MREELSGLVDMLKGPVLAELDVITWGAPVPSFGDLEYSTIATLGLNPSNKEFVDNQGRELMGADRRFHTLNSLGLQQWSDVNINHLESMMELCRDYFGRNPYDSWFKKLDYIISGTAMSYYFPSSQACHLDLVPFATSSKWTNLTERQKTTLLEISGDTLGLLLNTSSIKLLILNGKSVVEAFQKICEIDFDKQNMIDWTLPRKNGKGVLGYAYEGKISKIGEIELKHEIMVIGFNHNIQSSYGVTNKVQTSIRNWVSKIATETI